MHETLQALVIGFWLLTALLLVMWMGAFEYTAFQLEHRFPDYYRSIGDPRLSQNVAKGIMDTYLFIRQLLRGTPPAFPADRNCRRSVQLFRLSFWIFAGIGIGSIGMTIYANVFP